MTIHEILDYTTAELEQLSDDQLKLYMADMFIYTRPTSAAKIVEKAPKEVRVKKDKPLSAKAQALKLLEEMGIV